MCNPRRGSKHFYLKAVFRYYFLGLPVFQLGGSLRIFREKIEYELVAGVGK